MEIARNMVESRRLKEKQRRKTDPLPGIKRKINLDLLLDTRRSTLDLLTGMTTKKDQVAIKNDKKEDWYNDKKEDWENDKKEDWENDKKEDVDKKTDKRPPVDLLTAALIEKIYYLDQQNVKVRRESESQVSLVSQQLFHLQGRLLKEQIRVNQLLQDKDNVIASQNQEIFRLRQLLESSNNDQTSKVFGSLRRAKRQPAHRNVYSSSTDDGVPRSMYSSSSTDDSCSPGSTPKSLQLSRKLSDDPRQLSRKNYDDPSQLSRKLSDDPRQLSRKNYDDPSQLSRKLSDDSRQLSRKTSDDPRQLSRKLSDDPRQLSRMMSVDHRQLSRNLSTDDKLLQGPVSLTRQTKVISKGAERPKLKQSVSVGNLESIGHSLDQLNVKGILKSGGPPIGGQPQTEGSPPNGGPAPIGGQTSTGGLLPTGPPPIPSKPPIPSRQGVNEKLRIQQVSDDSGRESDVRVSPGRQIQPYIGIEDSSGNPAMGQFLGNPVMGPFLGNPVVPTNSVVSDNTARNKGHRRMDSGNSSLDLSDSSSLSLKTNSDFSSSRLQNYYEQYILPSDGHTKQVKRVSFDTKSNRLHDDDDDATEVINHRETQSNLDTEKIQGDKINQNVVEEPLDQNKPKKESTNKESKSSETLPSQKLCTVSKMNSSIFNSPFNKGPGGRTGKGKPCAIPTIPNQQYLTKTNQTRRKPSQTTGQVSLMTPNGGLTRDQYTSMKSPNEAKKLFTQEISDKHDSEFLENKSYYHHNNNNNNSSSANNNYSNSCNKSSHNNSRESKSYNHKTITNDTVSCTTSTINNNNSNSNKNNNAEQEDRYAVASALSSRFKAVLSEINTRGRSGVPPAPVVQDSVLSPPHVQDSVLSPACDVPPPTDGVVPISDKKGLHHSPLLPQVKRLSPRAFQSKKTLAKLVGEYSPTLANLVDESRPILANLVDESRFNLANLVDESRPTLANLVDEPRPPNLANLVDESSPILSQLLNESILYSPGHSGEIRSGLRDKLGLRDNLGLRVNPGLGDNPGLSHKPGLNDAAGLCLNPGLKDNPIQIK